MANVRDLLIKMSLDSSNFKTSIDAAKRELRLLKAEYKAVEGDSSLEDSGAKLLANLQAQKAAMEAEIKAYQEGIDQIKKKLETVTPGSQNEQTLVKQATELETKMKGAEAALSNLETKLQTAKMDNLLSQAQTLSSLFMSMKLGFGELLDSFGDAADTADKAFVSREAAFTQATKNVEDAHQKKKDLDALNKGLTEMTARIPQTYQQLAGLMGVGATLGVPYENLLEFTEVMAKLNVATNVAGEGGAQAMAQFLNITEKGYGNLARVGAALTELGNNSATTEQNILEMAHRASTGLSSVGMGTPDILALSAALNSVGIEAQAGGSSISKLGVTMDKAANVGAQQISRLLDAWGDDSIQSIYDLYALMDQSSSAEGWRALEEKLGMTAADTKALMNSALAAERFSQAMGITVDQFSQGWNEDAASQMLSFFRALGEMSGETEQENMLWVMDQLGIKEVRQSNMVRALANNWELYAHMLTLGRNAYKENVALENEAERAFSTNESRRIMNANKAENAAEAMGETVTAMRKPFEDFFGDLQQWYADWPDWAQTAVGAVSETLGKAGGVIDWLADASFAFVNITNAMKELKSLGAAMSGFMSGAGGTLLKGGAIVGGAALAGYGLYELINYISDLADRTDDVSEKLANLQINIDEESKRVTLAAIKEVQDAVNGLTGEEDLEKYANTSRVVQMGYGTPSMFGTALGYENAMHERRVQEINRSQDEQIAKYEQKLLDAEDEYERKRIQRNIENAEAYRKMFLGDEEAEYRRTIQKVVSGGLSAAASDETDKVLESITQKYAVLDKLLDLRRRGVNGGDVNGGRQQYNQVYDQAIAAGIHDTGFGSLEPGEDAYMRYFVSAVYDSMAQDVQEIFADGELMSIALAAIQSGALDNVDQSKLSGSLLGLFEAIDIKGIADSAPKQWTDIGKNSMLGLGQGITDNKGDAASAAAAAANDLADAAKKALGIQSPSTVFQAIGENIDLGMANGIYARADEVLAAASWLAAQVESTMREALDINSPSGVAKRMGVFLGEGLAQGIESSLGRVERAAGRLAGGVSAAGNRPIDVTLNLDGKTLTRVMVPMMDQALGEAIYE